ncbi:MAG: hypothetical protein JNN30_13615 [Rhodanobacteraceae bacterium]|nr:hypothetical protein [Rhodanobacteraceae bacterium]
MILFVLGIAASILIGDILYRCGASAELARKSVHVGCCTLIAAFPVLGIGYRELSWIAAGSFVVIALLRNTVVLRAVMAVERKSYGDLMLPLSVVIVSTLALSVQAATTPPLPLEATYPAFLGAYLVLGISDTCASLFGRAYGQRRYRRLGHGKSYVGSAAFFVSACVVICLAALFAGASPLAAMLIAGATAAALTVVEAFSHKGTDNLSVPLIAAASLHSLLSL